jgi:hypothetical protein
MQRLTKIMMLSSVVALSGCADLTHFNTSKNIPADNKNARLTYIDAKQRVVISAPVTRTVSTRSADGNVTTITQNSLTFCAEPSPDALSALAASGGGNLSAGDKLALGGQFTISEGASSIGLRTQTIQMMRDAMYRLCEATASGVMTPLQFEMMHRRFQNSMVAILAIEQLTGAVHGPAASISGRADFGNSELVAKLTDKVTAARSAVGAAEADVDVKKALSATASAKPDDFLKAKSAADRTALAAADKTEYDKLTKAVTDAKEAEGAASTLLSARKADLANYQAALASAQSGDLQTGTTAITTAGGQRTLDSAAIANLSGAIQSIVRDTFELGYFRETCTALFTAQIEGRPGIATGDGTLASKCLAYADQTVKMINANIAAQAALLTVIKDSKSTSSEKDDAIKKIINISRTVQPLSVISLSEK